MKVDEKLRDEMAAVAARSGCELLEIEAQDRLLRLVVDRPEGVTIDDCQVVGRQISALLDVEDFGSSRYTLEVTSPGLDRKLYGPSDYERFRGNPVRVTFQTPEMERQRTVEGRLEAFRESAGGALEVAAEGEDEPLLIPLESLRVARLVPEL